MKYAVSCVLMVIAVVGSVQSMTYQPVEPVDTSPAIGKLPFPRCGPVCLIFCPNGNVLDSRGCPTCKCRDEPRCGPVCEIACLYGKVLDSRGCPTCRCREQPVGIPAETLCPLVKCASNCPNGFRKTARGCQTCQCLNKPRVCRQATCRMYCPNGFMKDKDGCTMCRCKRPGIVTLRPPRCPLVLCDKPCPGGYVMKNGCQTCQCRSEAVIKPACGPICKMGCPNGFVKDSDGCPICKCRQVTPRSCRRQCSSYCRLRTFIRRSPPSGCDCNCRSFRPRNSRFPTFERLALP